MAYALISTGQDGVIYAVTSSDSISELQHVSDSADWEVPDIGHVVMQSYWGGGYHTIVEVSE